MSYKDIISALVWASYDDRDFESEEEYEDYMDGDSDEWDDDDPYLDEWDDAIEEWYQREEGEGG